ncbi:MAG: M48 family metallopeptidase [Candidatus Pacebacteria bacterium]|nr:M48 family metallopeptidase [Candidatus Paceibacterota bacterium]
MLRRRNHRHYCSHKEQARAIILARVAHYNRYYNHGVRRIFIKNSKSRWGSCSSAGNLNFNYKLLFLPPEVLDYVVVHELCHLKHFNHGPEFWAKVAEVLPNHKDLRVQLRTIERGHTTWQKVATLLG